MAVDLELEGSGWARATVAFGDAHATVTASYLSDAPRDLVEAAAVINEGALHASCSWAEEPGEYRWLLRTTDEQLEIEILQFDKLWGREPDSNGKLVFYARSDAVSFGRAVLRAMDSLMEKHGEDGYAERWARYSFPSDEVERLRLALALAGGKQRNGSRPRARSRSR